MGKKVLNKKRSRKEKNKISEIIIKNTNLNLEEIQNEVFKFGDISNIAQDKEKVNTFSKEFI
jgi:hypothetical protein